MPESAPVAADETSAAGESAGPRAVQPAEGGLRPRRRTPIINRRGPSEIDRALRMNKTDNGRGPAAPRKPAEGSTSRGTVIRLDRAKGFGFLVDSAGEHRFFHRSAVLENGFATLKEQQTVEFEAHTDERGARALQVRPAGTPPSARPAETPQRRASSPKAPKSAVWRSDLSPFRNGSSGPSSNRRKPLI